LHKLIGAPDKTGVSFIKDSYGYFK
jgi:hypothetical protein